VLHERGTDKNGCWWEKRLVLLSIVCFPDTAANGFLSTGGVCIYFTHAFKFLSELCY
jgi:hypothetical protein